MAGAPGKDGKDGQPGAKGNDGFGVSDGATIEGLGTSSDPLRVVNGAFATPENVTVALTEAKKYADDAVTDAVTASQLWLPAVANFIDLPTPPNDNHTYLCRVNSENNVYQHVHGDIWRLYSENTDFVDENQLSDAITTHNNSATSHIDIRNDIVDVLNAAKKYADDNFVEKDDLISFFESSSEQGKIHIDPVTKIMEVSGWEELAKAEEGTWEPVLEGATTAGVMTYNIRSGTWKRSGKLLAIQGRIQITNKTGATGIARISNFPFPVRTTQVNINIVPWAGLNLPVEARQICTYTSNQNGINLYFTKWSGGGNQWDNIDIASHIKNDFYIDFGGILLLA